MLSSSVIYNVVVRWPFVANHILLESLIDIVILGAIGTTIVREFRTNNETPIEVRDQVFDRFAPVVGAMTVLMYYLIFVTKLNWDFVNLDTSCVTLFYEDVLNRFSFLPLPTGRWAVVGSLWAFLIIEIVLPVLLTFRKTRYYAFVIGLPFHILLGLIGHRTFSAFIFALYGLFCAESISKILEKVRMSLGEARTVRLVWGLRLLLMAAGILICVYYFTVGGDVSDGGRPPLRNLGYRLWYTWSVLVAILYFISIGRSYIRRDSLPTLLWSSRPGLLWLMLPVVFLDGMSPYLGLKTETSFAMYSSLRTEGEWNNHFFMPALRVTDYQDDLVEILETDNERLQDMMYIGIETRRRALVPYFELHRVVSEATSDFHVTYERGGKIYEYSNVNGVNTDPELARKIPLVLSKLLYFRPITAGDKEYCKH